MKAIVYTKYGSPDVLRLMDVEKPVPKDDQVLIKVHAASINALDWRFMRGKPSIIRLFFGLSKPNMRPGRDVAGVVEAVGKNATQFKPGDAVFGASPGTFSEYTCASASKIVIKPEGVTFEQAASVPVAALTALQALRDNGKIQAGMKVLVDGAGGGVGTFSVQIAKSFGAKVTATCSTRNLEMARSIDADHIIDYTKDDVTRNGQQYDLILAANGYHSISDYRRVLSPKGIFVMVGGSAALGFQLFFGGWWISRTSGSFDSFGTRR